MGCYFEHDLDRFVFVRLDTYVFHDALPWMYFEVGIDCVTSSSLDDHGLCLAGVDLGKSERDDSVGHFGDGYGDDVGGNDARTSVFHSSFGFHTIKVGCTEDKVKPLLVGLGLKHLDDGFPVIVEFSKEFVGLVFVIGVLVWVHH
jgi:hypothetical protein